MNANSVIGSTGKRAAIIGTLTVILLLVTAGGIGLTTEQPASIAASESYTTWFHRLVYGPHGVLNQRVVDNAWEVDTLQPPLDKSASGIIWSLARVFFDDLLAHRLANILLVGFMTALLYSMVASELGEIGALAAVAALLTMPRFFFHASLAAADVPSACMIVVLTFFFWRTKESARFRYTLFLGLLWGLALSVNLNTWFVLPALLLWTLLFRPKLHLVIRLMVAFLLGLPVFIALWPWLYYDTTIRLKEFLQNFWTPSSQTMQYYLGRTYSKPPWQFSFVMTWAVIPLGTSLLYFLGILRGVFHRRYRAFCFLLFLIAIIPVLLTLTKQNPIHDNERLLIPAFPFLATLAGVGFSWLVRLLRTFFQRIRVPALATILAGLAAILAVASPVYSMATLYPLGLSYYSESVGGLPGAKHLGLETTYWCEGYNRVLDYINDNATPGDTVWVEPGTVDVMLYYQLHNQLRSDISFAVLVNTQSVFGLDVNFPQQKLDFSQADFVIIQYRQSYLYDEAGKPTDLMKWISDRAPAYRIARQGVPIVDVYRNP
jgi:hypothetical protein